LNNAVEHYLREWGLTLDGEQATTRSSVLAPVRCGGVPAMLKIARVEEERRGGALMAWWGGDGAARVLARDGQALLLERVEGENSLTQWAEHGRDDDASRLICAVAARLHTPRVGSPPELVPLARWFAALEPAASMYGGVLKAAAEKARSLLAQPLESVVLHGDLHHGNVLDGGRRGWLAIDPKGLVGERGFDFANVFCNPAPKVVTSPGRLARQASMIAGAAGLERKRLLEWVLAYAGLSAAWSLGDGQNPELSLSVAELAAAELAEI